jgi:peroxin-19
MREMGGLGGGVDGGGGEEGGKKTEEEKEQERAFRAAWEAMLVEGMDGMVASPPPSSSSAPSPAPAPPAKEKGKEKESASAGPTDPSSKQDFQAGIRAAFEKLKSSESGLKVRPPLHSNYRMKLTNN